jgi:hypothetical protein
VIKPSCGISLGRSPTLAVLPVPSRPLEPYPKHRTPPLANSTHVWKIPADTCSTASVVAKGAGSRTDISFGSSPRSSVAPVPSWPYPPYPKQTRFRPRRAHVCEPPALIPYVPTPPPRSPSLGGRATAVAIRAAIAMTRVAIREKKLVVLVAASGKYVEFVGENPKND